MEADRLRRIVAEVLGCDASALADDLKLATTDTWDSLNHLRIVTAAEEEFGIRLSMEEIQSIDTIATLASIVRAKAQGR
jgi:acyl carrier protein